MTQPDDLARVCQATAGTISTIVGQSGGAITRVLSALFGGSTGTPAQEWPLAARVVLCFVPSGVPLLDHRSAFSNVRHLCALGGRIDVSDREITHALRHSDLPDRRFATRASRLDGLERLAVWLAVHRLRRTRTIVLDDPTRGLTQRSIDHLVRLLRETAAIPSVVIVSTPDTGFASTLSDSVTPLGQA